MPAKALIAIQARSGSTRLPRKAFALIGEKRLLDHVIDACAGAAKYLNLKNGPLVSAKVAMLVPNDDPIAKDFAHRGIDIVQGPEYDVLARYFKAAKQFGADYYVRITGDCPMIPSYLIAKMVKLAVKNRYDYVSNVDEECRTAMDGHDCEVISANLLAHINQVATSPQDREHVTLLARREPPSWAKIGCVINYQDQSDLKLSVDTQDDLDRAREEYAKRDLKKYKAERKFGVQSVHRF